MTRIGGSRAGRSVLAAALALTLGSAGYLQVRVAYDQNETVRVARELATSVEDVCRDDLETARRLGREACDRATQVADRSSTEVTAVFGPVGHVVGLLLAG